jgi:FPC/CPF motif-containing protein YcgG
METSDNIVNQYLNFLANVDFPCVAARAAQSKNRIQSIVAGDMGCPTHDSQILQFIYNFVDHYRMANEPYHTAAVIFKQPTVLTEQKFDSLLWQRLSSLSSLDRAKGYKHDARVDSDPASPKFSFSLKEEAFFVIGLHSASERKSRQFKYPTLIFNPHAEFEKLRTLKRYDKMKKIVRKRDVAFSGSVNPSLHDFGERSEVYQYSGVQHSADWVCPLKK